MATDKELADKLDAADRLIARGLARQAMNEAKDTITGEECPWCKAHPHREACCARCKAARENAAHPSQLDRAGLERQEQGLLPCPKCKDCWALKQEDDVSSDAPQSGLDEAIRIIQDLDCAPQFDGNWRNGYSHAQNDAIEALQTAKARSLAAVPSQTITPLLQKIVEICDAGSAQEFADADERLRSIRALIIGESV